MPNVSIQVRPREGNMRHVARLVASVGHCRATKSVLAYDWICLAHRKIKLVIVPRWILVQHMRLVTAYILPRTYEDSRIQVLPHRVQNDMLDARPKALLATHLARRITHQLVGMIDFNPINCVCLILYVDCICEIQSVRRIYRVFCSTRRLVWRQFRRLNVNLLNNCISRVESRPTNVLSQQSLSRRHHTHRLVAHCINPSLDQFGPLLLNNLIQAAHKD